MHMKCTKITEAVQKTLKDVLSRYPLVVPITQALHEAGGQILLVGGAVRDLLLGKQLKDLDIEIHKLPLEQVEKILRLYGPVSTVGKSFGVLRVHGLDVDWSLPRSDSTGRKPVVVVDPHMGMVDAFKRRDLTINAMGIDLITHELIDPFNGQHDLMNGILRCPDATLFVEDPLRFYRVMQFVGRFAMEPDTELNALCARMDIRTVSVERIEVEFQKLLLQSQQPSRGVRWLHTIGRLGDVLPEVAATIGVEQDQRWHPEGDVFEHTMQALDAAVAYTYDDSSSTLAVRYAALCHDFGKVSTTVHNPDGTISSHGHELVSVTDTLSLLKRIMRNNDLVARVTVLVRHHMAPGQFVTGGAKAAAYKRLARELAPHATLQLLADLASADMRGRNPQRGKPLAGPCPMVDVFRQKAEQANVIQAPESPVLQGRDLLDVVKPGPRLGELLAYAYQLQIEEGVIDKEELKRRVLEKL